jgi:RNA polymerase sigma-70 factor (ECF subfamily)
MVIMATEGTFADFIQRIRAGDARAAEELVKKYEPAIRMEIRMRLSDRRLGRLFDSMDICQSVLGSFFVRAAVGEFDLEEPGHLIGLLVVMARNKLAAQVRRHRTQRRDHRRTQAIHPEVFEPPASDPTPSRLVAGEELLLEFRKRFSQEERQMAELRAQGQEWAAIARQIGGTPQARRKQLERAVRRVTRELGLDEESDE